MSLRLEEIAFNHDSASATHDALNIRRNAVEFVPVPEWRRGVSVQPEDSPCAYAMEETRGNAVTIKVRLRSLDDALHTVEVRAIDPTYEPYPGAGVCVKLFMWLLKALVRLLAGNVLGEVKVRKVIFPPGGVTGLETFKLTRVNIQGAGVGSRTTTWHWQYRLAKGSPWFHFETTRHRVYVVAAVPQAPWVQTPHNPGNIQLPWTEVLDRACTWATLAKTADQAAARVTREVYNLGPSVVTYDCPGGGGSHYAGFNSFDCTHFLERLTGGFGNGIYVNCTDCATIVSTFANALGADLWQSRMEEPPGSPVWSFGLNPMLGIGSNVWQPCCGWSGFNYHEVAWKDACTADDEVYDACLQVDGDADPTAPPHTALLPVDLKFGAAGAGLYRDRLATPAGRPYCEPNPGSRKRRSVI